MELNLQNLLYLEGLCSLLNTLDLLETLKYRRISLSAGGWPLIFV